MTVALDILPGYETRDADARYKIILGTLYTVTAVTSSLATLIIAYRICSVTSHSKTNAKRYMHIIEITVQSVSVYTALMLGQAVFYFLAATAHEIHMKLYISSQYLAVMGIIATVSSTPIF